MIDISRARVLVAGAGAMGSVIALYLAERGARVVLADPAGPGDNASGVAAGMLAPAFEAALDAASRDHFAILSAARDLWPDLAARLGVVLDAQGALWAGPGAQAVAADLTALGARAEPLTRAQAEAISPGLNAPNGGVLTPEDWRLDPAAALRALAAALAQAGAATIRAAVTRFDAPMAHLSDGSVAAADVLILAGGLGGLGGMELAPELSVLTPIKGQILTYPAFGAQTGPVVRAPGVYAAPGAGGLKVGATMEPGLSDRRPDPDACAALARAGAGLFPHLGRSPFEAAAAVRAATHDALPLVGWSSRPGVFVAAGARRNGWLLAPLVAGLAATYLAQGETGSLGRRLDPARFSHLSTGSSGEA